MSAVINQKAPLSVIILTKNEEGMIEDCLASVRWAAEMIVLDDESADQTVAIAQRNGAKIYSRKMNNEGEQRNFGIEAATQNWVLMLDADERVSRELAEEIRLKLEQNNPAINGYSIPMRNFVGKRWIAHSGYYPACKLKLFQKEKLKYEFARVHPKIIFNGKSEVLQSEIIHYSYRDFAHFIAKLNCQTDLEAEKWLLDKRRVSLPNTIRKVIDRFFRNYIGKEGWKDGFLGFMMCSFHGLYQLLAHAKYWELKRKSKVVFVDRDGVINEDLIGDYIKRREQFRFIPGVPTSLKRLRENGFQIIVISNQAGIGDGEFRMEDLNDVTRKMNNDLKQNGAEVSRIYYCTHGKEAGCPCRKPKTGLLEQAARDFYFDRSRTFLIGDKISDMEAARAFGLKTIFVLTGHGKNQYDQFTVQNKPEHVFPTLNEAVDFILGDL